MCFGKTQLASSFTAHLSSTLSSPFRTRLGAVLFCFSGFVFSLTGLHDVLLSIPKTQNCCNHCCYVLSTLSYCLLTRFTCHMFGGFSNSQSCYTLYYQLSGPQWHRPGHTKTELPPVHLSAYCTLSMFMFMMHHQMISHLKQLVQSTSRFFHLPTN